MIENSQDSERIEKSSFQEETPLENFFTGANRGEILSQMKEALQNGIALLVLTGDEGSGKTMICRLFEHEVSLSHQTVFFPRAVDSFEDTLGVIAQQLKLDTALVADGGNAGQVLDEITVFLLSQDVDLLIIFDEAENIFLATLERIRKMLDRVNESGARMHILFSGRETFLENCEQLSLCDFQNTHQHHFDLAPLSKAETSDYLNSCALQLMGAEDSDAFSDEVIAHIHDVAQGNFKMINVLAEEAVGTPDGDTSFMVLLKDIKEGIYAGEGISGRGISFDFMRQFVGYLPWIGGGAICLLLLFVLLSGGDEDRGVSQETVYVEKSDRIPVTSPEQEQSSVEKESTVQILEENVPEEPKMVMLPVEKSGQLEVEQEPRVIEQGAVETTKGDESEAVGEALEKETVQALPIQAQHEVVTQDQEKKNDLSLKQETGIPKIQSRAKIQKNTVSASSYAVDQLYKDRVRAGAGWEKRAKGNMFTVQLMALASIDAEKNLKRMLTQVDYRQEAGNFYIFKQATTPGNIYVFYGEYPSIERARLVTNSLPEFLRNHKPYAISIKSAMAKVKK